MARGKIPPSPSKTFTLISMSGAIIDMSSHLLSLIKYCENSLEYTPKCLAVVGSYTKAATQNMITYDDMLYNIGGHDSIFQYLASTSKALQEQGHAPKKILTFWANLFHKNWSAGPTCWFY